MSGFDDDFGELVGGGEPAGEQVVEDPAAEFLAREQEQLGELETELAPLAVSPQKSPVVIVEKPLVREEPAVIKERRAKQTELLRKKDEEEENARNRLRDQAAQELADWYAHNSIQVEKLREANREAMENTDKTFVAQMEPILPGTEWDRVSKLCDFNPKTSKNVADVSRMRSIILQLKQGPANNVPA